MEAFLPGARFQEHNSCRQASTNDCTYYAQKQLETCGIKRSQSSSSGRNEQATTGNPPHVSNATNVASLGTYATRTRMETVEHTTTTHDAVHHHHHPVEQLCPELADHIYLWMEPLEILSFLMTLNSSTPKQAFVVLKATGLTCIARKLRWTSLRTPPPSTGRCFEQGYPLPSSPSTMDAVVMEDPSTKAARCALQRFRLRLACFGCGFHPPRSSTVPEAGGGRSKPKRPSDYICPPQWNPFPLCLRCLPNRKRIRHEDLEPGVYGLHDLRSRFLAFNKDIRTSKQVQRCLGGPPLLDPETDAPYYHVHQSTLNRLIEREQHRKALKFAIKFGF
ncbi:hypothetical protein QOT17_019587 [Balamuthia mandrillaris]